MLHDPKSGNLTFAWEPLSAIIEEAMPMLAAYWDESQLYGKELPMEPDYNSFFEMERIGRFRVFCARRGGRLIGVNSFIVGPTLLRRQPVTALAYIFLISPLERMTSAWTGLKMVKLAENGLRSLGLKLVIYNPGSKSTDMSPLLRRLKYVQVGNSGTWEKLL